MIANSTKYQILFIAALAWFQPAYSAENNLSSNESQLNYFSNELRQSESEYLKIYPTSEDKIIDDAEMKADVGLNANLDNTPSNTPELFNNSVVPGLQQAAIDLIKDTGTWGFEFIYYDKNGNSQVLSQYNIHQQLKPASTQKLFSGYLAYVKQSYPRNNLAALLHVSHNEMADAALKTVAAKEGLQGDMMALSLDLLKKYYSGLIDFNLYNAVDGSGLSYDNKVTPSLEISLLTKIYSDNNMNDFKMMLAHPAGQACIYDTYKYQIGIKHNYHSTLASKLPSLAGKLHAKTGTLDKTKGLAGFIDTKNGGVIIFSIIGDYLNISAKTAFAKINSIVESHSKYVDKIN